MITPADAPPAPFPRPPGALGTVYLVFPELVSTTDDSYSEEFLTCSYFDLSWNMHEADTLVYEVTSSNGSRNVTFVQCLASDLPGNLPSPVVVDSSQLLHSASAMTMVSGADPVSSQPVASGNANRPMIVIPASAHPGGAPLSRYVVLVFKTDPGVPATPGYWQRSPGLVATSDPEIMPSTLSGGPESGDR